MAGRKAVFLDKDGTLIERHPFAVDRDFIEWLPGTIDGLRLLHRSGYALIVLSDQADVAQGRFTMGDLLRAELSLRAQLAGYEVPLAGFFHCPHHPEDTVPSFSMDCCCRKSHPALLIQAARELNVDLRYSWMVGDTLDDIEAGRAAGCRTILLTNGNETEWNITACRWPDCIADEVFEAARLITYTDQPAFGDRARSQTR